MHKSYFKSTPRVQYALDHSTPLNKYVEELIEISLKHPMKLLVGARGVLQMCVSIIEMVQATNVLDIGLFTGVSALTWALAIPKDGKVISMDVDEEAYITLGKRIVEESGVAHKIDIRIQPAMKTLHELIDDGLTGTFDFVFLDANKVEYVNYFNLCLKLLRPGGVLAVDNALFKERVLHKDEDASTMAATESMDQLNKMASANPDVRSVLLPFEDGLHIIVKKNVGIN